MFTGDRSGDWLYAALHRAGLANQPTSVSADDGLRLRDAYVTAVNRCAPPDNKPTPAERDNCLPYLVERAGAAASGGGCWWRWGRMPGTGRCARCARWGPRCRGRSRASGTARRPRSGGLALVGCFHPSQQNTFTGRLTEEMLDAVLARARELASA